MRFFSSSALASAPKLRFAASCSAAETMFGFLPEPPSPPPRETGLSGRSADTGHYLVLGRDKSIVRSTDSPRVPRAMTQMLRRLAVFRLGGRQDLDRAAGLLDRGNRRLGGAVHLDGQLGLDLATAEQPHAVLGAA